MFNSVRSTACVCCSFQEKTPASVSRTFSAVPPMPYASCINTSNQDCQMQEKCEFSTLSVENDAEASVFNWDSNLKNSTKSWRVTEFMSAALE
ncbi:hypothetical protein RRG08_049675 [Elysia crispata]|uniref:Uncharacterized protein n=1 Tax=Elysia crispata TaxID=231223 RepID=A0AAE0Y614_9GAST|nr:hypothetical protein RRG08_049675 [Elysia crispata]